MVSQQPKCKYKLKTDNCTLATDVHYKFESDHISLGTTNYAKLNMHMVF